MASWDELTATAPELADSVKARFEAHGLALLATLRRDRSPRISGIETSFFLGELWVGMMDDSLKLADVRRDPRLALHAATVDKDVADGDAKIAGRAVEVGTAELDRFVAELRQRGDQVPDGPFPLFRVDVREVSMLRPAGDHLVIDIWTEAGGLRKVERR